MDLHLEESLGQPLREMAVLVAQSLGIYLVLPMLVAVIILRVLRVRGQAFRFFLALSAIVGIFLFLQFGVDQFGLKIQQSISQ
ncbi:O-antigen ligase [Paenibacillus forsythiae]|uniref:O-antigen ligase n=1 Tax=Paenibacillus forsythiae TaxID=365616 RepID=A0ABU3H5K3_9BACL|nr:hypothetical protein [Paenibacillus forsythiae]MDT3426088.1 O-antigen ligase [Paenibacillus forsythiae]